MATITFKGNPVHTIGSLPPVGAYAPVFKLATSGLEDVGLDAFAGKWKILHIVPSLDTGVCAISTKRFHHDVAGRSDAVLLNISADLPFAQKRFCDAEHLDRIVTLSTFRSPAFGAAYGVTIVDGPLAGLMSRAVLVLDPDNKVVYAQQVPEIAQEPDYGAVLAVLP